MLMTGLLPLLMISILGAVTPGPSLALISKHSLGGGRKHGLVAAWSHAIGIALYALLTMLGLTTALQSSELLFKVISCSGALYLAWLGYKSLTNKSSISSFLSTNQRVSLLVSAREGFLMTLLNPKIAVFFIAVFSEFVSFDRQGWELFVVILVPFLCDGIWYSLVTILLSSSSMIDKFRAKSLLIDRLSGIVFIGVAGKIIWSNIPI